MFTQINKYTRIIYSHIQFQPQCELLFSSLSVSGEVAEFGLTLEVRKPRDRTQSLSNVDILISPCDPDNRLNSTTAPPPSEQTGEEPWEAGPDRPVEKSRLEAAVSFPLERSKVMQYLSSPTLSGSPTSNRKSISSTIYSPAHQNQEGTTSSPTMTIEQSGAETSQEADESRMDSNHGNGSSEEPTEQLLLGEDRMYPTLRSKSLNTNPRKTRVKKNEETPRSASSVKDLVSAFSGGGTSGTQTRTSSRDSE